MMTQNFKDKLYLLALGTCVGVFTFFFGMWSDQFLTRADYDQDRVTNAQVVAKIETHLKGIEKSIGEVREEMREIRREVRRVD